MRGVTIKRNRDAGIPGHPTQFAPSANSEADITPLRSTAEPIGIPGSVVNGVRVELESIGEGDDEELLRVYIYEGEGGKWATAQEDEAGQLKLRAAAPGCDEACWTPVPCPDHGSEVRPRGASLPMEGYECCERYVYSALNTRHLWDEHDSNRIFTDPAGWAQHERNCDLCRPETEEDEE